jgi:hypothetical protein
MRGLHVRTDSRSHPAHRWLQRSMLAGGALLLLVAGYAIGGLHQRGEEAMGPGSSVGEATSTLAVLTGKLLQVRRALGSAEAAVATKDTERAHIVGHRPTIGIVGSSWRLALDRGPVPGTYGRSRWASCSVSSV